MRSAPQSNELQAEEARLRTAYARREAKPDRYSFFDPANLLIIQERERAFLAALRRYRGGQVEQLRVLEVGCGSGFWLRQFVHWGFRPENLTGVEVLSDRVEHARRSCPADVRVFQANAASLNFADASFDLVLQSTMFSSVLHQPTRQQIAREMRRVTTPDGLIFWYDFHVNNPANPDVHGIRKTEIRQLFPGCRIQFQRLSLLPPLARVVAPRSALLFRVLSALKLLCTHYLAIIENS